MVRFVNTFEGKTPAVVYTKSKDGQSHDAVRFGNTTQDEKTPAAVPCTEEQNGRRLGCGSSTSLNGNTSKTQFACSCERKLVL